MKTTVKGMALLATLFVAAFGFANTNNLDQYPAVRDALNNDNVLLYTYYGAQMDDYVLEDALVHPIFYVIAPVGQHDDCTVELRLNRDGEELLITVQILDDGDGNLSVGDFKVERD